ncbi:MAG: TlpA family protein disulfide reductase [Candidatus Neomarinimicrobiota bacterium]
MNKRLLMIIAVFTAFTYAQSGITELKLKQMNGKKTKLSTYLKDGPVLINFWATWCAPCKKEMIHLNSLQKKYAKEGLTILAVSTDSQKSLSKVRSYIRAKKYSFDVILDPNQQIFKKMNASIMPTDILIGKDGDVLWRHYGYLPGDEKYIEAEIRNALGIIE